MTPLLQEVLFQGTGAAFSTAAMFTKEQEHLEELRFHNRDTGLNEVTGRLMNTPETHCLWGLFLIRWIPVAFYFSHHSKKKLKLQTSLYFVHWSSRHQHEYHC